MVQTPEEQAPADPNLRRTGIPPIGPLPGGSHVYMFYETPEDLIDAHGEYFGAGLVDNERCVWVLLEPVDRDRAIAGMRKAIPGFDDYLAAGAIELIHGREWYLQEDKIDPHRITGVWLAKLDEAVAQGFAGLRISGNAFWMDSHLWDSFLEYEEELQRSLAGARMVALCTYPLQLSRAADLLDVARAHHVAVTRRNGKWEFVESSQLAEARREISRLNNAIDILSRPFYLPETVDTGDWIEIGHIGAYSLALRTHFNGFYPDTFVEVTTPFEAGGPAESLATLETMAD